MATSKEPVRLALRKLWSDRSRAVGSPMNGCAQRGPGSTRRPSGLIALLDVLDFSSETQ